MSAQFLAMLADEWERVGLEFDLTTGRSIAQRVERGTRDPVELARAVPSSALRKGDVARDAVSDAIERALERAGSKPAPALHVQVLFVAPGPNDQARLRTDSELRDFAARLRASTHRERLELDVALATRATDLIDAVNRIQPDVLHISGHGGMSGIAFEDAHGRSQIVSADQLSRLIVNTARPVRLVILNACDSSTQAELLTNHVDAAIGMTSPIGDEAACVFAEQLYSSIAEGLSLAKAFEQARLQITLAAVGDDDIPVLFTRHGIDAAGFQLLD